MEQPLLLRRPADEVEHFDRSIAFANNTATLRVSSSGPLTYISDSLTDIHTNNDAFEAIMDIPVLGSDEQQIKDARSVLFEMVRKNAWWISAEEEMDNRDLVGSALNYKPKDMLQFYPWPTDRNFLAVNLADSRLSQHGMQNVHRFLDVLAVHTPPVFHATKKRLLLCEPEQPQERPISSLGLPGSLILADIRLFEASDNIATTTEVYKGMAQRICTEVLQTKPVGMTGSVGISSKLTALSGSIQRGLPLPEAIDVR